MRLLLATAFALIAAPALADPTIPTNDIITAAITDYIRPSFAQFETDTGALKTDMTSLCAVPSTGALTAAQGQFKTVVTSYSRIEFLHLGPLTIGNRAEQLLFWPDSKGIALKQVQQALAQKDPTATSADTLKNKSVAMQGLGALEFVLFGTGSETLGTTDGAYRCSDGRAIATLVGGISANPAAAQISAFAIALPANPCVTPADVPWISIGTAEGTTAPGATSTVDIALDAAGIAPGHYAANLCVHSNDRSHGLVAVPVDLDVQ